MENSLLTASAHKQKKRGRAERERERMGEKEVVKIERVFSTKSHEKPPHFPHCLFPLAVSSPVSIQRGGRELFQCVFSDTTYDYRNS